MIQMKGSFALLKKFFINYLWFGVLLIFISLYIDAVIDNKNRQLVVSVLISLLNNTGIAILIASIFTFASGTSEFIEKITNLLKSIVIDRNFLSDIDQESKRNALAALIKPSKAEMQLYADIGRYYDMYISHTMDITSKCVRSDYSINAVASIDKEKKVVKCKLYIVYRLHPTVDGYKSDINIKAEDRSNGSDITKVRIFNAKGEIIYDSKPDVADEKYRENMTGTTKVSLHEIGKDSSHLKVEIEMIEFGEDHWKHLSFQSLEPTDGFRFRLECRDNLKIVSHNSYIHGANFHVYKPNYKTILFSCDEWMNEGSGLSIVIAKRDDKDDDT